MTWAMSSVISSIKNTFLHFDVDTEQSPCNRQPSLGRARTMPTPTSRSVADSEEADAAVEASRPPFLRTTTEETCSDESGDPEDASDAESLGPQPDICRDNTYNTFDDGVCGEAEAMAGSRFPGAVDREAASDEEPLGPQPSLCRDNTYNAFDDGPEAGQPCICRDTTYDAFDAEGLGGRRAAAPEPQRAEARAKTAPATVWQAQPPAAQPPAAQPPAGRPSLGAVVLPSLLAPFLAGPQAPPSAGRPALVLVGLPPAAQQRPPAAQPAPEPARPAAEVAPARRQGTRRQPAARLPASPQARLAPGSCQLAEDADALRLHWAVDARKLRKNERLIVSPLFDLPIGKGRPVQFRLMLFPSKGVGSFRASNGVGTMLLKCEATEQESPDCCLDLRFTVGWQPPRGPVSHNFARSGVCGLPENQQEWSFARSIDQALQTVAICLEIVRRR